LNFVLFFFYFNDIINKKQNIIELKEKFAKPKHWRNLKMGLFNRETFIEIFWISEITV
jgi:hypothetical protein